MRRKSLTGGLALVVATAGGCTRNCYITCDDQVTSSVLAASGLEIKDPNLSVKPTIAPDASRPQTSMTRNASAVTWHLAEAIAISLEQGTVGNQSTTLSNLAGGSATGIQTSSDQPVSFNGRTTGSSDAIRVLALDPASIGVGIDNALSKFDALWVTSSELAEHRPAHRHRAGRVPGGRCQRRECDSGAGRHASTSFVKPLPTGGIAGITFSTPYTLHELARSRESRLHPGPAVRIRAAPFAGLRHRNQPVATLLPGSTILNLCQSTANLAPTQEGILITRIRFDQQRAEFQRNVHQMLVNVEIALLEPVQLVLAALQPGTGHASGLRGLEINLARYNAGRAPSPTWPRLAASTSCSAASACRPSPTSRRTNASSAPCSCPPKTALVSCPPTRRRWRPTRPTGHLPARGARSPAELYLARQDVKANQLNLVLQENSLLPDLRFAATYDINAHRHTGSTAPTRTRTPSELSSRPLQQLGSAVAVDGADRLSQLPTRNIRLAKLQLVRSYETLHDQELNIERFLALQYRRIFTSYELIRIRRLSAKPSPRSCRRSSSSSWPAAALSTSFWRPSGSGLRPWRTNTPPSATTTTCSPASNSPRARSCSTTTSSSPRGCAAGCVQK